VFNRKASRLRRAKATRARIARLGAVRLTVHRTNLHIYASVISADGSKVLASASTVDKDLKAKLGAANGSNKSAATMVGTAIAERAKAAGVTDVAFDRSGFQFHGRVAALAAAAREAGLKF
jgi:large subunit ribosomal protein L18